MGESPYAAAWDSDHLELAIESVSEDSYPGYQYSYYLDGIRPDLTDRVALLALVDRSLSMRGGPRRCPRSLPHHGLPRCGRPRARALVGSRGRGWLCHLAGVGAGSTHVETLSYANGKVWIASTSGGTLTWRGYDVTL